MMDKIGVAILIGGKSIRMGQRKDQLKESGSDVTFLLRKLKEFQIFDYRFVSANKEEKDVEPLCKEYGYSFVIDESDVTEIGPMGAIVSVLRAARKVGCTAVAIVAVDMPFFDRECVLKLIENFDGEDIVLSRSEGGREPLASVYCCSTLEYFENCVKKSDYRLNSAIKEANCKEILWNNNHFFINVNTPEEYDAILKNP